MRNSSSCRPAASWDFNHFGRLPRPAQVSVGFSVFLNFAAADPVEIESAATTLKQVESSHILKILRQTRWVVGGPRGAAARLGLKRTTLMGKMRRLGLSRPGPEAAI